MIPEAVLAQVRERVWQAADGLDWLVLSPAEKTKWYSNWEKAPDIGDVLERYVGRDRVHVYLKDTVMKKYARARLGDVALPYRVLGVPADTPVVTSFERPHGRHLADGRVITWGRADEWKGVLIATFERAFHADAARPFGAVLLHAGARYAEGDGRRVVETAADRLGIEVVVWLG